MNPLHPNGYFWSNTSVAWLVLKCFFLFQAEGQKRDLRGVFMVSGLGGVSFLAGLAWSLRAAKQQDDILTNSAPVTV